ncbi:MAG: threonine synthase [Myxococcota bacterium]
MLSFQSCVECQQRFDLDKIIYGCECGGLIEVKHPVFPKEPPKADGSASGVWRFKEVILPIDDAEIVSHPEGNTRLYERDALSAWAGVERVLFKHEGENPTGSFKDRGMTVAVTQAKRLGQKTLACASTGNTSASLAAYGAQAGLKTLVFLPEGKVAPSKLSQAVAYGAECRAIAGDFDLAMQEVVKAADKDGLYLVNSINPFRLEGQKSIMWELFDQLQWQPPDWIVVPGGNLGNTSAFGKAILEAFEAKWIQKKPRIAVIQAQAANPFYQSFLNGFKTFAGVKAETKASAINIGMPVNFTKAKRVISDLNGRVEQVNDEEIREAKRVIDHSGIGCEPASAASLAGLKKLVDQKFVKSHDTVVCILTGHVLKDPVMS